MRITVLSEKKTLLKEGSSSFSRQHYQEIAGILKAAKDSPVAGQTNAVGPWSVAVLFIANELSVMFKRDNPAFDHGKFMKAAGF